MRARLNFPARRDRRRKRVRWCLPSPLRQFEQVAKPPGVDGFCRRAREKRSPDESASLPSNGRAPPARR